MLRKCRICHSRRLKKVFSLGKQPLANNLLETPQLAKEYPLELYQCQHCTLIQLGHVVPKEHMYDNYLYIPSISKTYLKHFDMLAAKLVHSLKLKKGSLVVDIGSSDGSFLRMFEKRHMDVLGVEPAQNIETFVPKLQEYFDTVVAEGIVVAKGKAKLVTMTNVFAHIDDIHGLLKALDILLDDDGVFFAQFPDVRNLLRENQFDTIYHEHLSYFTYEPLHHLFANSPFELFEINSNNIHGGSMQILVRRRPKLLEEFQDNVNKIAADLTNYIVKAKAKGKKVVGFGAAAKGVVLLNRCGLGSLIDYVVDGTPYKQGKYIPGVNIPVVPEEKLDEDPPDIVLILAWNFKDEIIAKLRKKNKKFTYIIPIPKVKVVR